MTTNSQLSTTEPKKTKTKTKQTTRIRKRIREMDITWRVFSGEGERRNREEKVQGIRSIIGRHYIDGEKLRMV